MLWKIWYVAAVPHTERLLCSLGRGRGARWGQPRAHLNVGVRPLELLEAGRQPVGTIRPHRDSNGSQHPPHSLQHDRGEHCRCRQSPVGYLFTMPFFLVMVSVA
jgi:hypothetical protein